MKIEFSNWQLPIFKSYIDYVDELLNTIFGNSITPIAIEFSNWQLPIFESYIDCVDELLNTILKKSITPIARETAFLTLRAAVTLTPNAFKVFIQNYYQKENFKVMREILLEYNWVANLQPSELGRFKPTRFICDSRFFNTRRTDYCLKNWEMDYLALFKTQFKTEFLRILNSLEHNVSSRSPVQASIPPAVPM